MDTRLLASFLAVVRTGTFTAAASELGFTQSTVTAHVQKLERELGCRLLDRLPGAVVITSVGDEVRRHAEEALAAEARMRAAPAGSNSRPSGTVRLLAPESLCTYWLPEVVGAVRDAEPDVQIWISPGGGADALDAVHRGLVDLAITLEPRTPPTDMELTRIGSHDLVLLDRPAPPGGRRGPASPVTWEDLVGRDALLIEEGCGYSDLVVEHLSATGRAPGRRTRFGSVEAIKRCVGAGLGWTALPRIVAEADLRSGALSALHGPDLPACEVHLVSSARRYRSPAARVVFEALSTSWPGTAV